jgi:hypothetical protein
VRISQRGDVAGLSQAARPDDIEHDDVDRFALDELTLPVRLTSQAPAWAP